LRCFLRWIALVTGGQHQECGTGNPDTHAA
jgi:hypothetical protein